MDLKQIEKMMAAMNRAGMKRMVIKQEGFEIELEKESYLMPQQEISMPSLQQPRTPPPLPEEKKEVVAEATGEQKFITSPMVGTFYAQASPDTPSFVKAGDRVEKDTVVCIIEAMKVMNEVKAGISGTVAEILLKNGAPVEFGTKLIRVV